HADAAIGGVGVHLPVVNVGADRVQRHAAFALPNRAGHFGTAQTTGDTNLHALRAGAQRAHDRLLECALIRHAAANLLGDAFGYQVGIKLRLLDLFDVQLDLFAGHRLQV